MVLPIY